MNIDAFFDAAACELRSFGFWVIPGHEQLWVAHYFSRPTGKFTLTGPQINFEQPHWHVIFHDRLADVYGFPIDVALGPDLETGISGLANQPIALTHCVDGYIYLGDFNGIDRNVGLWIPNDDPSWRFQNRIQNMMGAPDPHGVIRTTNELAEAYKWLQTYNGVSHIASK